MNINQKINAKGNAVTWRLHTTSKMIMKANYKQPFEGMFCPHILMPKQWKTNYQDCGDLTKGAINY